MKNKTLALEGIRPEQRTLPALLKLRAERLPHKAFLIDEETVWTGEEALQAVQRRAFNLKQFGIEKDDKVAIIASNSLLFVELFMAVAWVGGVVVPINSALKGTQLQHVIENSDAHLLLCEPAILESLNALNLKATALKMLWTLGPSTYDKLQGVTVQPLPLRSEINCEPEALLPSDVMAILYTSGTSGPAKGVVCPHAQFYWWGIHTGHKLELTNSDKLYNCLPLFHTNAINTIYQALVSDSTMIIGKRFSASRFFQTVTDNESTVVYLLGAMIPILLAQEQREVDQAHRVRLALGPSVSIIQQDDFHQRFGFPLLDGYASTETNFIIGGTLQQQRQGYMGKITPGFEARVVDTFDETVNVEEVGELIVRSNDPYAFSLGYYKMAEATIESRKNLWFHTGDRVSVSKEGYFKFVDRLKDMIRRRGENISSYEVESALSSYPDIESVAVYAVESDLAEEEVMATLTLRKKDTVDFAQLIEHCQKNLAYFAIPRYFRIAEKMPLTENGKIQKYKLRGEGITPDTWDREKSSIVLKRA